MRLSLDSLQARIAFFHLLAIAIAAVLVPLANYLLITQSTNQFETRTLRDHATTIDRYLSPTPQGWRLDLPDDLRALYAHGMDGLSYAVVNADGRPLFVSGPDGGAAAAPASAGYLAQYAHNGSRFYSFALQRGSANAALWIKVSQDTQHPDVIFDDIVSHYLGRIGWFTVAILALLLAIDIVVIRTALAPVLRSSQTAGSINPSRIDLRLPQKGVPRELRPLIAAMNQALDRLQEGMRLQREFTSDAAHELRTPLAVLRARVEMMPDQQALAKIKADIVVMSHVVDQLLEMAEIEGLGIGTVGKTDLSAACADVAAMLAEVAIQKDKSIALFGAERPIWVQGDATMIFRAIRNLVDNAIKHTRPGTTVELEVKPTGSVSVSDCGAGVSDQDRDFIFRRFWRGDRNAGEGTGLGLAIVSRIAEIHAGSISVANRPGGGAAFTLSLPLAD
jgi:signal transduction histidine kinase